MALADRANEYVDRKEPWKLARRGRAQKAQDVCTVVAQPVPPDGDLPGARAAAARAAERGIPGRAAQRLAESEKPLVGKAIQTFQHLMQRVDPKKLEAIIQASTEAPKTEAAKPESPRSTLAPTTVQSPGADQGAAAQAASAGAAADDDGAALAAEPLAAECTIRRFRQGRPARRARGRGRRGARREEADPADGDRSAAARRATSSPESRAPTRLRIWWGDWS